MGYVGQAPAAGSVTTSDITDGTIANADIASDAAIAMELGADAVLMNTGIALAQKPVQMAEAMKLATQSGRIAYLSGRISRKLYATASSPVDGVVR